jgi:hypothetical protein
VVGDVVVVGAVVVVGGATGTQATTLATTPLLNV